MIKVRLDLTMNLRNMTINYRGNQNRSETGIREQQCRYVVSEAIVPPDKNSPRQTVESRLNQIGFQSGKGSDDEVAIQDIAFHWSKKKRKEIEDSCYLIETLFVKWDSLNINLIVIRYFTQR